MKKTHRVFSCSKNSLPRKRAVFTTTNFSNSNLIGSSPNNTLDPKLNVSVPTNFSTSVQRTDDEKHFVAKTCRFNDKQFFD
jgi:hypothetical protein